MLILSDIPDAQTKMCVFKKGSHVISIGNLSTAANIHCVPLIPLLTHYIDLQSYAGSLQTGVGMAGLLINFSDFSIMKHNFTQYAL